MLAQGDVDKGCASVVLALRASRASLFIQVLHNLLLDDRVSSLSLLMKQMLHPRCERVTRRATTQKPIIERGVDSNLLGWQPKETAF